MIALFLFSFFLAFRLHEEIKYLGWRTSIRILRRDFLVFSYFFPSCYLLEDPFHSARAYYLPFGCTCWHQPYRLCF
jgi:hypothetical protein